MKTTLMFYSVIRINDEINSGNIFREHAFCKTLLRNCRGGSSQ